MTRDELAAFTARANRLFRGETDRELWSLALPRIAEMESSVALAALENYAIQWGGPRARFIPAKYFEFAADVQTRRSEIAQREARVRESDRRRIASSRDAMVCEADWASLRREIEVANPLVVGEAIDELCGTHDSPTRLHLARLLVERGLAKDIAHAFDHWLGRGQAGYAPAEWPALADTVKAIREAGGQPVLAHPHRYKISAGALRRLLAEFCSVGGLGIEVAVGGTSSNDFDRLAQLARANGLAASSGSDFHDPAIPWNPPGRFAKLPPDLEHVAARLQR